MSAKVLSAALVGLEASPVEVEADTGGGELGTFTIVGLPDAAVSESRERVRSAVKNSGFDFPKLKVTVNLAPADLKKQGPAYDLPIAVSILMARGLVRPEAARDALLAGELALDGSLRPINGALALAELAAKADIKDVYLPEQNAKEAALIKGINVYGVKSLSQLIGHLKGERLSPSPSTKADLRSVGHQVDMSHICGQSQAKRALEIAAAGGHNLLFSGAPGAGKTMMARAMVSILPDLTFDEALEITKIYSVAGSLPDKAPLLTARPFRSPHHSASAPALIGGGAWPKPGEISLAHRGVLFLDEFGEFPKSVLDSLRQPLEDGVVSVSRVAGSLNFPAKFILVAAMNPCPCGYLYDKDKPCQCSPHQINMYRKRVSGPIKDRIDIFVNVRRLSYDKLSAEAKGESSSAIKQRIESARRMQQSRLKPHGRLTNSEMSSRLVKQLCALDSPSQQLIKQAVEKYRLSPRQYFKTIKVARTIADLQGAGRISSQNVAEALQYRLSDESG